MSLCNDKGLVTEEQRAELAGVDRNTVRRWLLGENSPRLDTAMALADELKTTVNDLWFFKEAA